MNLLSDIFGAARDRRVVPPLPVGRSIDVSLDTTSAVGPPRPGRESAFAMLITYCDREGAETMRRIACRRIDVGSGLIQAHCFERSAFSSFRVDRVREAFCVETGEALDVMALLADLRGRGLPVEDSRLGRLLTTLVFLMRCDGDAHASEREAIERAVTSFAVRFDGDDQLVDEGIVLAGRLAPDGQDFVRSLKWMARHRDRRQLARFMLQQAASVVDADGRIADEEVQFGAEVGSFLKALATAD